MDDVDIQIFFSQLPYITFTMHKCYILYFTYTFTIRDIEKLKILRYFRPCMKLGSLIFLLFVDKSYILKMYKLYIHIYNI